MLLSVRRLRLLLAALAIAVAVLIVAWLLNRPQVEPPISEPQPELTRQLRSSCQLLLRQDITLPPPLAAHQTREGLAWACARVGVLLPWPREFGCGRSVTYEYSAADGLEQNLLRYAVLFGFLRLLRADAMLEPRVLTEMRSAFPSLSLPPLPSPSAEGWQPVAFWPSLELLRCPPGELPGSSEPQRYRVNGPPDGSAVHLFHPFEKELRRELRFSSELRRLAEKALLAARGRRSSATYVGLLVPVPDGRRRPASDVYLRHSLSHYRRRFADALFVVVAADAAAVSPGVAGDDVVLVEAAVARDSALSLAVRAACNHSIVTADDGFWGGYLAGGEVTAPEPEASDAQGFGWLSLYSQIVSDKRWTVVN